MNTRGVVLIVVALVLAGLAAFLARSFLDTQDITAEAPPGPKVLIAKLALPIGKIVIAKDLQWIEWPVDNVYPGYAVQGQKKIGDFVGSVVRDSMVVGEPITLAKLVRPGERGFMSVILKPGMRAITIPVNRTSGVAGFIFPGDRVDILLNRTKTDDNGISRVVTETVFRNVRILAVDLRSSDAKDQKPRLGKSVTIEVTPVLAEKMRVLQRLGGLTLSLRSMAMDQDPETGEFIADETSGISERKSITWDADVSSLVPPLEIGKTRVTVVINRGNQQQTLIFKRDKQ